MEVYSDAEIAALQKFKPRVSDVLPDEYNRKDENLIRWLRARDLDLNKAEELLRKSMQWREDNKIESILESGMNAESSKLFPFNYDGKDKEGRLVVTVPFGEWDIRDSVEKDGPERFTHYTKQMLEMVNRKVREIHEKENNNQPRGIRYTIICDYAEFSLRQMANMKSVNTILNIVGVYEAHYPETMQTAFIINAPSAFSILFNLMKPLMTGRTLNKIKIFNSTRENWEPEVLKAIDASQLRPRYGGTKAD